MKPVLSSAESARLDRESATPVSVLMERAGRAVANAAVEMGASYGDHVVVLAGPGNNGGDGYVAAKCLRRRGVGVEVLAFGDPKTEVAGAASASAAHSGVIIRPIGPPVDEPLVLIDALFGGGFRGSAPSEIVPWMDASFRVLAVDIATGVAPDTGHVADRAFVADRTLSFHSLKAGHLLGVGPDHSGRVDVVDIGLEAGDPDLLVIENSDAARPWRSRTAHKWSAGSVLVLGGASGMMGAAVMAARSALHFGAGAAGISSDSLESIQVLAPEALAYPADVIPERYSVLVVGPGLGDQPSVVERAIASGHPLVIDADALSSIPPRHHFGGAAVLTPHAGEFQRLSDESPGADAARRLANRMGAVVVLKGNPTIVTDGGTPRLVTSGGPELATIGTGDVLSGMIGALLGRGLSPLEAASSAAYWHGVAAADLARTGTVTADVLSTHVGRFAWEET